MIKECIICNNSDYKEYSHLYDDRYGYPDQFLLTECLSCRHKQLQKEFKPEMLTRLYTDYYPRSTFNIEEHKPYQEISGFKAWFNGEYSSAFRYVPKNVRVLDIGCGFGATLGYHQSRNCDVYGVEADENILKIAEHYGYKVHWGLFDENLYETDFFDYITMDQVIEHVTDPVKTLTNVAKILKPGGKLILSTPNSTGWGAKVFGKYWINWHVPYHLQHFSLKSMKISIEKAGLKLEKYATVTSSEWLRYQWIHLVTFPEIGTPSSYWSPNKQISRNDKLKLKMFSVLHRLKLNHLVTRIFDLFNTGDSFIFFLSKK